MFKLRILAGLLILLTGCSTTRRAENWRGSEKIISDVKVQTESETEHVTEAQALAPPPGTVPEMFHPPTNHFTGTWIPLNRWSEENHIGPLQRISSGTTATFALKAANGLLILRANDLVARWNGSTFRLGFQPQLIDNQLYVHTLDLTRNIEPLLHGFAPPAKTNRVIVIDPGHGGSNPGTVSVLSGRLEKEFTLDWALRLKPLLETNGWTVFLTRTSDVTVENSNRVVFADAHHADLFLSLHFNATGTRDPVTKGIETYCITPVGMPSTLTRGYSDPWFTKLPANDFDEQNLQLAVRLQSALIRSTGLEDRGISRARFMTVLQGQRRPAALIEAGYLSNPRDAKLIESAEYRQKLAETIAAALMEKPKVPSLKTTDKAGQTNNPPIP